MCTYAYNYYTSNIELTDYGVCHVTLSSSSGGGREEGVGGGRIESGGMSTPDELTGPAKSGFNDDGAVGE